MALWSYDRDVAPKSCNEPEYAVVSNSRTNEERYTDGR
jgi:hypothetical protein